MSDAEPSIEIISCPQCGVPAEVVGDFTLGSTHGRMEHLVTICAQGHWLTPRREQVPEYATPPIPGIVDPTR